MDVPVLSDPQELIHDVSLRTYWEQWTIVRGGERGSRKPVLAARHDDDDIWLICYRTKPKQNKRSDVFFGCAILILQSFLCRFFSYWIFCQKDLISFIYIRWFIFSSNFVSLESFSYFLVYSFLGFFFSVSGGAKKGEKKKREKQGKTHKIKYPSPARAENWTGRQELCKWIITNNPYVKKSANVHADH